MGSCCSNPSSQVASEVASTMSGVSFKLGDGKDIPAVGFGMFQIKDGDAEQVAGMALKFGYRHIDTAEAYMNEPGVGKAIKASGIPRDQIFITTKLWPGNPAWGQLAKSYDDALASCKASVEKLGVEYVELYLIHTPLGGGREGRLSQYRALVECQKLGFCKSIGVSNFSMQHLLELEEAGLPTPAANQLELHPNSQKQELLEFMQKRSIRPIAYSSLAPMATWREGYAQFGGTRTAEEKATSSPTSAIAAGLDVSEAKLLLRYGVQKGWCVLPKSVNEARIKENLDIGSFTIPENIMKELDGMPQGPPLAFGSPGQPMDPTQCP